MSAAGNLAKLTPAKDLTDEEKSTVFEHLYRRLAVFRNTAELYALTESSLSSLPEAQKTRRLEDFNRDLNRWAQTFLDHAFIVCEQPGGGECPKLDPYADTSTGKLPKLPPPENLVKALNTILFLQITTSKQYSARTRSFLTAFGTLDEHVIVSTLKHPDQVMDEAKKQVENSTEDHAKKGKTLRMVGMGLGAIAGGVLVGVTGGLAAPLVGASVASILGWVGVGGTAAGLLASGLAGSSVICGALFGVYGARSTASMVQRHTREIQDLAIVPVRPLKGEETLAVTLCISGWLSSPADVTAPWTVCGGSDTFALQWEVKALEDLSNALMTLMKAQAMKYVKGQIIKRTIFATLMSSLSPLALLNIGQIIDNPWMNAKALAIKAGAVLGDLLSKRVFGTRPVTLTGYSLGALVIFEALKYLASLPTSDTGCLIQDVFLFGTPTSTDPSAWSSIRRLVAGRLVNGYSSDDYVLAVLSRASNVSWEVAGLHAVQVKGVENVLCEHIDGHTKWRGMIGKSLQVAGAPDIIEEEVELQMKNVAPIVDEAADEKPQFESDDKPST